MISKTRKVLVVDDDAVVGRSITRVLGDRGYQVRETLDGREALEELDERPYDLVFTDIRMPGMDGIEVATRLRASHPEVPVVVITGYGTEDNERRAREVGVAEFLRKPLSPETIVESAERAIRERQETLDAIRRSALNLARPALAPAPAAEARPAPAVAEQRVSVARNVALFFAAPFIGLAYIVAFPFVGFWALARYAVRAAIGPR